MNPKNKGSVVIVCHPGHSAHLVHQRPMGPFSFSGGCLEKR